MYGVWHALRLYDVVLAVRTFFTFIPRSFISTCTHLDLQTWSHRVDAITWSPPVDRALWILVILKFDLSKLISDIDIFWKYIENKGWVLCFQFVTILKEEKVHVVLCAVVLFCRESILLQYCASVLALTVVQPCLSCNNSVFNNTLIHQLSPLLLSDNCGTADSDW
jgi:hypothetical protein